MKRTGGGTYDPAEEAIYFTAGNPSHGRGRDASSIPPCPHKLMAVNELAGGQTLGKLEERIGRGEKVLLDSGIFWLTNRHARANGVTMDEALHLAPDQIDGFDDLWDAYLALLRAYEPGLWGYIELDQGGAEGKRATRALIEAEGFTPIPVYHPTVDGWDYFDELASQYDRICVGNVVQAQNQDRKRLLATLWERHRRYPDLWIHVLGLTPNEMVGSYFFNSCDSSSFVGGMRFGAGAAPLGMSALHITGRGDAALSYDPERDQHYALATSLAYSASHFLTQTWRAQARAQAALCPALPAVEEWEAALR